MQPPINGMSPKRHLFLVGPEPEYRLIDHVLWPIICRRVRYIVLCALVMLAVPASSGYIGGYVIADDDASSLGEYLVIALLVVSFTLVLRAILDSRARWLRWHAWSTRVYRHGIHYRSSR